MIGELASGVISKIVYGGLARAASGISVTIQRRQAIERALVNPKEAKAKKYRKALDDLQSVVANCFGTNNQRFADFLNELSRSAFPEILTETILKGFDASAAREIFFTVFENYKHHPEFQQVSETLYPALETAVRAQYDMLSADSDLLTAIASKSDLACTKLDALAIELDPNCIEHFFGKHGHEILFSMVKTASFNRNPAIFRVARYLRLQSNSFVVSPWITCDSNKIGAFLFNIIKEGAVPTPKAAGASLAREVSDSIKHLGMSLGLQRNTKMLLALAVLSEMEFAAWTSHSSPPRNPSNLLHKRKRWIQQLATTATTTNKTWAKGLEEWLRREKHDTPAAENLGGRSAATHGDVA